MVLLTNGCSFSAARIPDGPRTEHWAKHVGKKLNLEVLNLAEDGKSNFRILEETSRFILSEQLHIDTVIIQLTEWDRENYYKAERSFEFIPGEFETQLFQQECFIKATPGQKRNPLKIIRKTKNDISERPYDIGDRSKIYHMISTFTLLHFLQELCKQKGINFYFFYAWGYPDMDNDPSLKLIDWDKCLYTKNITNFTLMYYLEKIGIQEINHTHPTINSHIWISDAIYKLVIDNEKLDISEISYDKNMNNPIYDYT